MSVSAAAPVEPRVADHFPRRPKQCVSQADKFFACFSGKGEQPAGGVRSYRVWLDRGRSISRRTHPSVLSQLTNQNRTRRPAGGGWPSAGRRWRPTMPACRSFWPRTQASRRSSGSVDERVCKLYDV